MHLGMVQVFWILVWVKAVDWMPPLKPCQWYFLMVLA